MEMQSVCAFLFSRKSIQTFIGFSEVPTALSTISLSDLEVPEMQAQSIAPEQTDASRQPRIKPHSLNFIQFCWFWHQLWAWTEKLHAILPCCEYYYLSSLRPPQEPAEMSKKPAGPWCHQTVCKQASERGQILANATIQPSNHRAELSGPFGYLQLWCISAKPTLFPNTQSANSVTAHTR